MKQSRPHLTDAAVLESLAHPVRLNVLGFLMSEGPATASVCARAVGDSPSNCSYHLRVLARLGLVREERSPDGRERPWRAIITGYTTESPRPGSREARGAAALLAASLQLDQRLAREYLAQRDDVPVKWRDVDEFAGYALRVTPAELRKLITQLDALIRPLIAATRDDAPAGAGLVHVTLQAFPRSAAK